MSNRKYNLFVGCYGKAVEETIHWLHFDAEKGQLSKVHSCNGIENPSFLTINHRKSHLFTVSEVQNGQVVSFEINKDLCTIHELNRQKTKGGPCYLEIDCTDEYLFTANYSNGSIIIHKIEKSGAIGREVDYHFYHDDGFLPSKIHAIRKIPKTSYFVATDLGLNKLYFYTFNQRTGKLTFLRDQEVPKGSGPRHITFHPSLSIFYVVNEFNSTVLTYAYDEHLKRIHLLQVLPTLPETFKEDNYGADIHITVVGDYLYVSNRGHHSLTAYKVLRDGSLSTINQIKTDGKWPRNFVIIPNEQYIVVANEHTNSLVVMKILGDGRLQKTGHSYQVNKPVCLEVIE
ncbi:lactonase family protein [Pseudogracilibacillus auburnensis]|uniref:6-phosphogluconolactonase n=1 Tax=Pseudogracilibacillus auburnensis TaxID=1494959 RepID=A0A2V3W4E2_9BACI|nr:lactonase family protein [Pseudogracilibacillus auburnensis]PXW87948.1 6-phosphogluconolactonase [Pseudogracilibacillus auburnensis]